MTNSFRITTVRTILAAIALIVPSIANAQLPRLDPPFDTLAFAPELDVDLAKSSRVARGLYSKDMLVGNGRFASRGDEVTVRYFGRLADGRAFTTTSEPPATFKLGAGSVIQGWERGISGMRVGGIRQLVISPDLGYGKKGQSPVPPNAVLVFDIELLSVK
jgi:FKBP-type peptidyl-prolyl cis-trans isomerase FkpA